MNESAFDYFFPLFLCYLSTFETVKLQVSRNIVSQYFLLTIILESVLKCSDTMNVVNTTILYSIVSKQASSRMLYKTEI